MQTTLTGLQNAKRTAELWAETVKEAAGGAGPAGCFASYWLSPGVGGAGATPTAGAICTSATAGALPLPPGTADLQLALLELSTSDGQECPVYLFDRIMHSGGLDGNSAAAQTVSFPALPADRLLRSDGGNFLWFLEWYGATGGTNVTATVSYLNGSAAAGSTTVTVNATCRQGTMLLIPPAAGDYIALPTGLQLSGTGTAGVGNFGFTCVRKIGVTPSNDGNGKAFVSDWNLTGLRQIPNNACLMLASLSTQTKAIAGRIVLSRG